MANACFGYAGDYALAWSPLDGEASWCRLARDCLEYADLLSNREFNMIEIMTGTRSEVAQLRTIVERIFGPNAWEVD
jgi:hypothetical protein